MSETPLDLERSYYLKHTTRLVRANITTLYGRTDLDALEERAAETLQLNDIGRLSISCNQPLYFDPYRDNRQLGAFILVDELTNNTVAAGMIREQRREEGTSDAQRWLQAVGSDERAERLGHRGVLIEIAGEAWDGQSQLALALERALFERGCVATIVDVGAFSDGSRSTSLIADLASSASMQGLSPFFPQVCPEPPSEPKSTAASTLRSV